MARQVIEFSVFVASPSDVEKEVTRLDDVIDRLNLEWEIRAIRLKLVRWKTHANPAFGDDPQTVINEQIPADHDIFIGILWGRAGTPTDRAESGTIEEFRRAKERHDEDPGSIELMLHFKEAPISPREIDAKQFQAVQDFRSGLGKEGGLYWTFETTDEFERNVHMHLGRYLHKRTSGDAATEFAAVAAVDDGPVHDTHQPESADEPGLLDLQDEVETEFAGLREMAQEIAAAIGEVGELMARRTKQLEQAQQQPNFEAVRRKLLRNVSDNVAAGLDAYVAKTDALLPRFTSHLDRGVAAFVRAIPMQGQISKGSAGERKGLKDAVSTLRGSLGEAARSLEGFRTSVESTPGMTMAMNRSRRATAEIVQRQIDAMRRAELQLTEVESLIDDWLKEEK